MSGFKLAATFKPTGDQPQAIKGLVSGLKGGLRHQVLLGVTGSGKTFTMASVVEKIQRPTLVISHNKTLAAQLCQEFREFFPNNAVEYFVSYYDYYQPEAYIPQRDQYIAKEADINKKIDRLRLSTTAALLTRKDVIVVASVSSIYNLGDPAEYGRAVLPLTTVTFGERRLPKRNLERRKILLRLAELFYERSDFDFRRATFRIRGENIDVWPSHSDEALRLEFRKEELERIRKIVPVTGKVVENVESTVIYPAKHYITSRKRYKKAFREIRRDLSRRIGELKSQGKAVAAYRLEQRTNYDLELIDELGYCPGIENYSRYFDGRPAGAPPHTLLDFFSQSAGSGWLCFIDESHITIPQLRGMHRGDRSRKETLVEYGFRLPSALDNRPLTFDEFLKRVPQVVYTSATPGVWEISRAGKVVEQLIRPTGLLDPEIEVRPTEGQIENLIGEIKRRIGRKERVLVTTLTKRMAEDLAAYLGGEEGTNPKKSGRMKVAYLHADVGTLERTDLLDDLRRGNYDVLVGINLLREGLDLPEVSLVAILDADKEGFLRSETSLIQVMGRAARHVRGKVIMYADETTDSMKRAIAEVERRRLVQLEYNKRHHISPKTIVKPFRERLVKAKEDSPAEGFSLMPPKERRALMRVLEAEMRGAAEVLDFERAALLRDKIRRLKKSGGGGEGN